MTRRGRTLLAVLRALAFTAPISAAAQAPDPSALDWLRRIYTATRKLNYTGTFVYQHGQQVETSRITHLADRSGPHEKLETLDGLPREVVRTRDAVASYVPETKTVKIDHYPAQRAFPGMLPERIGELSRSYNVRKGDLERVAGYDCQVIELEPRDSMRYGHRLWADVKTGMLVKTRTYDARNEAMEQFSFSQLQIGGSIDREKIKPRYASRAREWRVEDSQAVPADLAKAGWVVRAAPPGFRTVNELTRRLGGTSGVGQIVLSDGLAAISVFIEPAKEPAPRSGLARQGAINIYMRPLGNHWITVVGEAPAESVKYVADAVEFRK
jgi:sigma-E factor negative regulatory protein RseB